jgi:trans-2,3-dihydro-3-hydroxyanthranilate isomerase
MRVPFRLVDVFTPQPLAGNQLCVVPEPGDLDDRMMLALAQEVGFSETTYVTEAGGDRYGMRIFTPVSELPFAGHPTLGTAFVLASESRISSPATQVVAAGEIPVEGRRRRRLRVDDAAAARARSGVRGPRPPREGDGARGRRPSR